MNRTKTFFKPYKTVDEFLTIADVNINQPVFYKDEPEQHPPIYFAIKNGRGDIVKEIIKKQKHAAKGLRPIELDPVPFTISLATEALKEQNLSLFIAHLNTLTMFDHAEGEIHHLLNKLDDILSKMPDEMFKVALDGLLDAIKKSDNKTLLNRSKYIEYLNTAFNGDNKAAEKEFNPDQLRILNETGFTQANKNQDDKNARLFMKIALQQRDVKYPQILFSQGLYLDNLDYAIELINKREGTKLKVDTEGVCSGFTKHWLSNENNDGTGLNIQNRFFRDVMEIASLSKKEIEQRVDTDKKFVEKIKDKVQNIDAIQNSDQFEGLTQRSMKKNYGFELISKYKINDLNKNKSTFAYLRVRYKNGDGHAIGIHIQPDNKSKAMLYKVWDSNHPPKTFYSQSKFVEYLNSFKNNPKVNSTQIFEFSPASEPATREKITAIDAFIQSTAELDYPPHSFRRSLLDCIKKLTVDYDNGVVPLNEVIPLLALLGGRLNNANNNVNNEEDYINLTNLNQVATKHSLVNYKDLDVNTISFLRDFVDESLEQGAPHIVTALIELGFNIKEKYLDMQKDYQDLILRQSIKENNKSLFDDLVEIRLGDSDVDDSDVDDPEDFHVSLVVDEIKKDPKNTNCQKMLANLLLKGSTLSPDDYETIENRPPSSSMFVTPPSLKQIIQPMVLQQVLQKIEENSGRRLRSGDKELLMMLDDALNDEHRGEKGLYDILTPTGSFFSSSKSKEKSEQLRQQIIEALQGHKITLSSSQQDKYPFLSACLKSDTVVVHNFEG